MGLPLVANDTVGAYTRKRIAAKFAHDELVTNVALADAAATLTAAQIIDDKLFSGTPTAARTLTTSTAALLVAALPGYVVGSSVEFTIVNLAAATYSYTVAAGTGVTIVGVATVAPVVSAVFIVRIDSATAVTVYRKS